MTETSPLAAVSDPSAGTPADIEIEYRVKAGRVVAGVEVRVTGDDGRSCPETARPSASSRYGGRGFTGSYYRVDDPRDFMTIGCAPATSARSTAKDS